MNFWKNLLGQLVAPLPLACLLLIAAAWLAWRRSQDPLLRWPMTVATLLLWLLATPPLPAALAGWLEQHYAPISWAQLGRWREAGLRPTIVVLGGGHGYHPALPLHQRQGAATRARLEEGIRLYRALPGSHLVLSGGGPAGDITDAAVLHASALALGVPAADLEIENNSRDTAEQAQKLAAILDQGPLLLVTSATHMPRAMAALQAHGLRPIAAPTHFQSSAHHYRNPSSFLPHPHNLQVATWAVHEYLGLIYYRLRRH